MPEILGGFAANMCIAFTVDVGAITKGDFLKSEE